MKYLVGIATHTGENIDIHFGHCKEFQIIEVTDNESYEYFAVTKTVTLKVKVTK